MLIESFLTKIASAIFKKALAGSILAKAATAYEIYSTFESIHDASSCIVSSNDCGILNVFGEVVSGELAEVCADRLLSLGSETFVVEETNSGIYIASSIVKPFKTDIVGFPTKHTAGGRGAFESGGGGGFHSGGSGNFRSGGRGF